MATLVDYNRKGTLLDKFAEMDASESKARLFETIVGIRGIIEGFYSNTKSLEKLEYELANYERLWKDELVIISSGVKDELTRALEQHPDYNIDTVNQVFIGLYRHLTSSLDKLTLDEVVDYDKIEADNMNTELADTVDLINIYHVLSSWSTMDERHIDGLNEKQSGEATKQFREFKKSARGFMHSFRSLLRQSYNIESAYDMFTNNKSFETYKSAENTIGDTIEDRRKKLSNSNSTVKGGGSDIIRTFSEAIELNAQRYLLMMGYEILNDAAAINTIPNPERFRDELVKNAFDTSKIRYFIVMPYTSETNKSVINLPSDIWRFYAELNSDKAVNPSRL